MTDSRGTNDMSNQSNCYESYGDYLKRAAGACEAGDLVLGMHLYLAAYERAVADPDIPDGMAIAGLREAWNLACSLKERSMAEYVFEKLEPFLTGDEIARCANKLQNLALDRLEEYGFSREELQDMANMISQDLIDGEGSIVKVESISFPNVAANVVAEAVELQSADATDADAPSDAYAEASDDVHEGPIPTSKGESKPHKVGMESAPTDFNPYDEFNMSSVGTSYHAATNDGTGSYIFTRDKERAEESRLEREKSAANVQRDADGHSAPSAGQGEPAQVALPVPDGSPGERAATAADSAGPEAADAGAEGAQSQAVVQAGLGRGVAPAGTSLKANAAAMPTMPEVPVPGAPALTYRTLAGFGETVAAVRELGVGLQRDGGFKNFIDMMNARHGLDRMPAVDTLLFRAPVIEDATRFVDATVGEIGLPVLRMSMEEGFQGAPVLCVTTFGDSRPRMNHAQNRFDAPGILVIDDLDMWSFPQPPENVEGIAGFVMANMSRGAREAMNLIRAAAQDPDVYVLVTATTEGEPDPFFYDLLEPITIIDIEMPTESERDEIWREIMHDHPSMRTVDRAALVRFSEGMPRYDLYMAARAAIEEAYKSGLVRRMYLPVTPENIFDKLAACQPLDSETYRAIEDEMVRSFQGELDDLENLIEGFSE